jgi:hypothetical protein
LDRHPPLFPFPLPSADNAADGDAGAPKCQCLSELLAGSTDGSSSDSSSEGPQADSDSWGYVMLKIGLVLLARRSASTAAAGRRDPRGPTVPTGPLAAIVLARPPPRCRLSAGMPAGADPLSGHRQLSDEAVLLNARVPSGCLLHCAALCATARLSQKC